MSSVPSTRDSFWTSPLAFLGSLCIHIGLAWLIITNMNSFGKRGDFGTAEEYREVGVFVVEETTAESEEAEEPVVEPSETLPELPSTLNESLQELPEMSSSLPDLSAAPLIGPGPTPTGQVSENYSELMSQSGPTPPLSTAGIPSTTQFFEIPTRGRSLVYIIDCSGSMSKHNAFRHAKAELMSSLERLDSSHKFQVLFYSDVFFEFRDRHGQPDIHWATAANLARARSYISGIDNSGGTAHFPALMKALSYSPEVIFFLTDGAEPSLSAKQLDEIKRKNRGRAAIHCVEFGLGPHLNIENFLNQLARQNGGTYRYRDMTQLGP